MAGEFGSRLNRMEKQRKLKQPRKCIGCPWGRWEGTVQFCPWQECIKQNQQGEGSNV